MFVVFIVVYIIRAILGAIFLLAVDQEDLNDSPWLTKSVINSWFIPIWGYVNLVKSKINSLK